MSSRWCSPRFVVSNRARHNDCCCFSRGVFGKSSTSSISFSRRKETLTRRRTTRRIVSSSSSSSPKKEEKEGGGGKKFASLDDHTINTILGPYEARECSAWTDYQRISNSWVKKISQECDEKTKRKITERHIEALSILFCQVAAKEEKLSLIHI